MDGNQYALCFAQPRMAVLCDDAILASEDLPSFSLASNPS
jgi:hypothetical protein